MNYGQQKVPKVIFQETRKFRILEFMYIIWRLRYVLDRQLCLELSSGFQQKTVSAIIDY